MFFRRRQSHERIVAAAVQLDGLVVSQPPPARHNSLLTVIHRVTGQLVTSDQQGFLTSAGRFVSRHDAREIAIAAKQVDSDCMLLTSEQLW
ncbi:MAG: hypothetical protein ABTQ31_01250 [Rhizobiaceae bacterium]|jgi:hypothetical protein